MRIKARINIGPEECEMEFELDPNGGDSFTIRTGGDMHKPGEVGFVSLRLRAISPDEIALAKAKAELVDKDSCHGPRMK